MSVRPRSRLRRWWWERRRRDADPASATTRDGGRCRRFRSGRTGSLPIYLLGLVLCAAAETYLRLRDEQLHAERLEARWYKSRLDELVGRLNPHFLFNALHTISALVRVAPERADSLIMDFSNLLRRTMTSDGSQIVPLHEEIEFVRHYLNIERVRFEDRLDVHISMTGEVGEAAVPKLFIQPLIDNAIHRGVAPAVNAGWIRLSACRAGRHLEICIRNSCPEQDDQPRGTASGCGRCTETLTNSNRDRSKTAGKWSSVCPTRASAIVDGQRNERQSAVASVIAEDEPHARRKLRDLLREQPDVDIVAEAANGESAVEMLQTAAADVALLDIEMPGLDASSRAAATLML